MLLNQTRASSYREIIIIIINIIIKNKNIVLITNA